jgi:hypothetical protein
MNNLTFSADTRNRNVDLGDEPTTETQALISTIKAHISAGDKAQDKAQRHYIAAGQHLKQLKAEHDGHDGTWAEWEALLKAVDISTGRASELMQLADGRKTLAQLRAEKNETSKAAHAEERSSLNSEEQAGPEEIGNEGGKQPVKRRRRHAKPDLETAISIVTAALKEMDPDRRAVILERILTPIGMVAAPAKAGNGLCRWVKDDGGRSRSRVARAGRRKNSTGDCVARAITIATGKDYDEVHDALTVHSVRQTYSAPDNPYVKWKRRRGGVRVFDPDHGCDEEAFGSYLESLGWKFTSTKDQKVRLRADKLPRGRLIVDISRHLVAVIDGVIHDTFDCGKGGRKHVKGYWSAPSPGCSKREEAHDNGGEPEATAAIMKSTIASIDSAETTAEPAAAEVTPQTMTARDPGLDCGDPPDCLRRTQSCAA